MKAEGRMLVAAFVLVAYCAGPVLAAGAVLAAVTRFVSGAWELFALAAAVCVIALVVVRRRSNESKGERSRA